MSYNFTFIVVIIAREESERRMITLRIRVRVQYSIYHTLFTYLRLCLRYGDVIVRCLIHYTIQCGTYIICLVVTVLVPHVLMVVMKRQ